MTMVTLFPVREEESPLFPMIIVIFEFHRQDQRDGFPGAPDPFRGKDSGFPMGSGGENTSPIQA
jgi:hypothetical protein